MKKRSISFELEIYSALEELSKEDQHIMEVAIAARQDAYAPYSNFYVGAAVRMKNGKIVVGNNQENASYPSGLCAERVAIFQAGAIYPELAVTSIAIAASSKNYIVNQPVAPCGNCRQSILEYECKQGSPIRLLMMGEKGDIQVCSSMSDILPLAFNSSFLK